MIYEKHGQSKSRANSIWRGMRKRCGNKRDDSYHLYGARGVTVCERWGKFSAFLEDRGHPPSKAHSLDRIDNSKGYEPGNCRWATPTEQARNRTCTVILTVKGVSKPLPEWAAERGLSVMTLQTRVKKGWSHEKSVLTPVNPNYANCSTPHSRGAKLTSADATYIRGRFGGKPTLIQMDAMAEQYGVTRATIQNVVLKRTWRHL